MAVKNKEHGSIITETERLIMREMVQSDFGALCEILCDEEVMLAAYEKAFSVEEAQAWINRQFKRYAKCGFGLWAVVLKETNEMIGQCGLTMQGWRETEFKQGAAKIAERERGIDGAADLQRIGIELPYQRHSG